MAYNITYNISGINTSTATSYYADINGALNSYPAYVLLLIIYIGVFVAYVNNDVTRAHITASASVTAMSILLFFMNMVKPDVIMIPVSLLVIGLIVLGFVD